MVKEDMRLVEVTVLSEAARQAVLEVITEENINYKVSKLDENTDAVAEISFPLPTRTVEPVRDRLHDQGVSEDIYTVITDPSVITSRQFDQLGNYETMVKNARRHRIARSELHSEAAELLPGFPAYVLLSLLSAILVTSGVLLDSVTVLIGSMVLSPLIWPPIAASVGTVLDDETLFVRSIKLQAIGVLVAMGGAFSFALLAKATPLVSSIEAVDVILRLESYTAPPFLLVVIAFSAGIAGTLGLGRKNLRSLIGMLAAVAVVLPLGVLGVALAWGRFTIAIGTGAVVLLNIVSVTFSGILILWYMGYHPTTWTQLRKTRAAMLRRLLVLSVLILLLVLFLVQLTQGHLDHLPGIQYG